MPDYVQRANELRAITGEGFTFLNIPRTYYGLLEPSLLVQGGLAGELLEPLNSDETSTAAAPLNEPPLMSDEGAREIIAQLRKASLLDSAGALSLDALAACDDMLSGEEEQDGGGGGGGGGGPNQLEEALLRADRILW